MTYQDKAITKRDIFDIVAAIDGSVQFDNLAEAIEWKEIRELVDPRGEPRKAVDLVDVEFTIQKMKPVHSSFTEGTDHFYWIVGVDENGERFNSALGGEAVVEELDAFMRLNYELYQAVKDGDEEAQGQALARGAGRPIKATLRQNQGGRFGRYYTLD